MRNLLEETIETIEQVCKKTINDIIYIGNDRYSCDWDTFAIIADKEYDSGYGSAKVAIDLKIIFKDRSWLSRGEYDGLEWWKYLKCPKKPKTKTQKITNLIGSYNPSLKELHDPNNDHHNPVS